MRRALPWGALAAPACAHLAAGRAWFENVEPTGLVGRRLHGRPPGAPRYGDITVREPGGGN